MPKVIRDATVRQQQQTAESVEELEEHIFEPVIRRRKPKMFMVMSSELSALRTAHFLILALTFILALVAATSISVVLHMPQYGQVAGATAVIILVALAVAITIIHFWQRSIIKEIDTED